jgi:hypothetical protein
MKGHCLRREGAAHGPSWAASLRLIGEFLAAASIFATPWALAALYHGLKGLPQ